ncbi:MAG: AMP-binding protein [Thermodesulfobacteriota bacterium]
MPKESAPLYEVRFDDYEHPSPWVRPGRPWEKLFAEGVPRTVQFPEIPLHVIGRETARKYPHNLAILSMQDQRKFTYLELMHYSDRIAAGLAALGVKKGDGVGLYMVNSPEFIFSVYGISQTGAVIVPLNPMLKAPDIEHIARDSGILKTVICSSFFQPVLEQVGKEAGIENIIVHGPASGGAISLDALIQNHRPQPPVVEINPKEDLCVLLYTGGTTGAPKGVMTTHYNLISDLFQMVAYEANFRNKEDIKSASIDVLPMCHAFGFSQVQLKIAMATLMILFNGFNPEQIMETIETYQAESFVGIPLMFQMLINDPSFGKYDLSSLDIVVSGAAPLPGELGRKWKETTGSSVGQGYGLSESSPTTHMRPTWLDIGSESIGIPLCDTDAKIVAPEDRTTELPIGEVGELAVKGPQIMKGYWKQESKTRQTIIDGWLYTGDLAYIDEKGCFYISGRQTDMIKYKGYKVLPDEVEDSLHKHPAVLECAVIGLPDPQIGETIKAFIVLKEEYKGKISEQDIMDWAKQEMAGYKWPRLVEFIDQVPRTAVGKVFRRALKEMELNRS